MSTNFFELLRASTALKAEKQEAERIAMEEKRARILEAVALAKAQQGRTEESKTPAKDEPIKLASKASEKLAEELGSVKSDEETELSSTDNDAGSSQDVSLDCSDCASQAGEEESFQLPAESEEAVPLVEPEAKKASWSEMMKQRRLERQKGGEDEIGRNIKSILNKLTLEKFEELYIQLLSCGISKEEHVRIMTAELFEKATVQHHFIDMYTQLCVRISEWCAANLEACEFKRVLLTTCQKFFEQNMKCPEGVDESDETTLDAEELQEKKARHKMRMMGNMRFVGQLINKKMLVPKICCMIAEDLMFSDSASKVEMLVTLLKTAGKFCDDSSLKSWTKFNLVFGCLKDKMKNNKTLPARTRFLLQDLMDLRADKWVDKKVATKKLEAPQKLSACSKNLIAQTSTPAARASSINEKRPEVTTGVEMEAAKNDRWQRVNERINASSRCGEQQLSPLARINVGLADSRNKWKTIGMEDQSEEKANQVERVYGKMSPKSAKLPEKCPW